MATTTALWPAAPQPALPSAAPQPALPFTKQQYQQWELGVTLLLYFWTPLRDAVACGWGGANSRKKSEWLYNNIAELWDEIADADADTVEDRLLQVMEDEFDVYLEDDSAFEIAQKVMALRSDIAEGNFFIVRVLRERFLALPPSPWPLPKVLEAEQDSGFSEGEGDDDSDDDSDDDEVMVDAPVPVPQRMRLERVVDEDGFELVQKWRRR